MKYVRTKDGTLICVPFTKEGYDMLFPNTAVSYEEWLKLWKFDMQIIKEADTIEELCDRYYGVDENGEVVRVHNWSKDAYPSKPHEWAVEGFCTKEDITIDELKKRFPKGIFGAIVWFDNKGNLHIDIIAKMNEKGELELL